MDTGNGNLIGLARAARLPELDGVVTVRTLTRWCMTGVRRPGCVERVRLGHDRIGRRLYTSEDRVRAFLAAVSGEADPAPVAERERRINQQAAIAGL